MVEPGLRERKKARTRQAIRDAAVELFVARGYHETTISDIAERAEVSDRTFFSYFPSKESVLFADLKPAFDRLEEMLQAPDRTASALETMRSWLSEDLLAETSSPELDALIDDLLAADARPVEAKGLEFMARIQDTLTRAIAIDLDCDDADAMPAIVATAAIAALYRATRYADGTPIRSDDLTLAQFDRALDFIHGGLDTLAEKNPDSTDLNRPR
jgi:AcrR family transcriptional regulator